VLGGIISSTSVTLRFARDSRSPRAPGLALAAGAVGACTVMLVRVTVACAVLNRSLALALPMYLWPAFLIGVAALVLLSRATSDASAPEPDAESPLQLGAALQMTALFQAVLFAILAVQSRWSAEALVGTAAFVGLTDLDALTLSLARSVTTEAGVPAAAVALVAGVLSNTTLKLAVAVFVGRGPFRAATALVLGAMTVATAVALMTG
jgi:uncharacterized membrane protein (DUF4010 family)